MSNIIGTRTSNVILIRNDAIWTSHDEIFSHCRNEPRLFILHAIHLTCARLCQAWQRRLPVCCCQPSRPRDPCEPFPFHLKHVQRPLLAWVKPPHCSSTRQFGYSLQESTGEPESLRTHITCTRLEDKSARSDSPLNSQFLNGISLLFLRHCLAASKRDSRANREEMSSL